MSSAEIPTGLMDFESPIHIGQELEFSSDVCSANENYDLVQGKLTLRKCC